MQILCNTSVGLVVAWGWWAGGMGLSPEGFQIKPQLRQNIHVCCKAKQSHYTWTLSHCHIPGPPSATWVLTSTDAREHQRAGTGPAWGLMDNIEVKLEKEAPACFGTPIIAFRQGYGWSLDGWMKWGLGLALPQEYLMVQVGRAKCPSYFLIYFPLTLLLELLTFYSVSCCWAKINSCWRTSSIPTVPGCQSKLHLRGKQSVDP